MRMIILFSIVFIVGCAQGAVYESAPLDIGGAQATADAARQQANTIAGQATVAAAQQTAVSANVTATVYEASTRMAGTATTAAIGTADSLTTAQTRQAMNYEATTNAIAANATATAVYALAQAESILISGEATRDANNREMERAAIRQAEAMNYVKITVLSLVGFAFSAFLIMLGYRLYNLSRPQQVSDGNGRIVTALPSGQFQVLATPRQEMPMLPAPIATEQPIQLPPLRHGHVLIAGETGSGKSTAMRAVLENRGNVVVLDPHHQPGEWGRHRVIGDGRNFEAIEQYMQFMKRQLQERYQQRAQGVTNFEPLTVATDEMPAIVADLGKAIDETWRQWLREGRKVGLFFAVSTQSTRVQTLGIKGEGDLLVNFDYALVLGKLAVNEYGDIVQGMDRPAVLRTMGGTRPVIIPHNPVSVTTPVQQPLFIAPMPTGLNTEWGTITPKQIQDILQLKRQGLANSKIEIEVFDQSVPGGSAYHKVKAVLDRYYKTAGGAVSRVE